MKNSATAITQDETKQWEESLKRCLEQERVACRRIPAGLFAEHKGKFIAVSAGEIIDEDSDELKLAKRVSCLPDDPFILILQITDEKLREIFAEP
jgi:hypothetical protein